MSTALQTTEAPKPLTIRDRLQSSDFMAAIAQVLPKHVTPERMIRTAILAMTKTPKLAECDQTSFFNAMLSLSQTGLVLDGRCAHLVPFKNSKKSAKAGRDVYDCTLIIGWQGYAEMAYNTGKISTLHASEVRTGDIFKFNKGKVEEHVPWFIRTDKDKPATAGEVYAVYSLAVMKDGTEKAEVMSVDEINAIRDGTQAWMAFKKWGGDTAWDPKDPNAQGEMRKKTVFKRLAKWLPLSPEIRDAIAAEDVTPEPEPPALTFAKPFELPAETIDAAPVADVDGGAQ